MLSFFVYLLLFYFMDIVLSISLSQFGLLCMSTTFFLFIFILFLVKSIHFISSLLYSLIYWPVASFHYNKFVKKNVFYYDHCCARTFCSKTVTTCHIHPYIILLIIPFLSFLSRFVYASHFIRFTFFS